MRKLIVLGAALLCACTTLDVTKVDPDKIGGTKGVVFALPTPFLLVEPKADGSIAVTEVYLPDPKATFAADSASYLATHTLDLTLENGLLTVATWKQDTSAVVAEATKSAGNLAAGFLEKQAASDSAAAKEAAAAQGAADAQAAEARKAAEAKLAAAHKVVSDAEDALAVARAVYAANPTPDNKARVAAAEATLANARRRLAEVLDEQNASNAANDAEAADQPVAGGTLVWGPMLYEVFDEVKRDDEGNVISEVVELRRAAPQARVETKTAPPRIAPVAFYPEDVAFPRRPNASSPRQFTITASGPFKSIDQDTIELTRNGTAVGTPGDYVQVSKQGPLEIQVQILDSAPAGSYELELEIPLLNGEEPVLSWSFKL